MKRIKKILVPTDFSNCARDAYHTALNIAERIGAEVEVVYFYILPIDNNLAEGREVLYTEKEFFNVTEAKMNSFLYHDFYNNYESNMAVKVKITHKIEIGFAGEKIIQYSERPDIDFIVMGTSGESPNFARFFGSIASQVATDSHCPVLLIPANNRFAQYNNVLYSSNEYSMDKGTLSFIFDWANIFQSTLHFIHVKNIDNTFDNYTSAKMYHFINEMNIDSEVEVVYETVVDYLLWRGLYTYADTAKIDLMVIVTKHRSFFEKLIHNSLTSNISSDAHLPILVLHSDEEDFQSIQTMEI
jgi:nucleotide-binding universal stress UspA family protein